MSIASQSPPVAAHAASGAPPARAASRPTSLDDLAGLGPTVLQSLYEGARTPVLEAMDGPLVGRMLAVPVLPRWMAGLLRWFAAWKIGRAHV